MPLAAVVTVNGRGIVLLQIVWFAAITLAVTLFSVIARMFEIEEQGTVFNVLIATLLYQVFTVKAGGAKVGNVAPAMFTNGPANAVAFCH